MAQQNCSTTAFSVAGLAVITCKGDTGRASRAYAILLVCLSVCLCFSLPAALQCRLPRRGEVGGSRAAGAGKAKVVASPVSARVAELGTQRAKK